MDESVSILIITRERREMLDQLLSDLAIQSYSAPVEIIVVEETDAPREIEEVLYVPHPVLNKGIAYARNMSVQHASHDLIIFIDDDCRVNPEWLSNLVTPFEDQTVLGVQGGVIVPEGTNAIGWAEGLLGFPGGGFTRIVQSHGEMQETKEVSTLNAAYRKSAVIKAGGFSDEARFGGEDYLLAKQVAEEGRLLFVPKAIVRHEARGSIKAIWHWFVRRGKAEFEMWGNGLAPEGFGAWLLRSSFSLKLLPFVMLSFWSIWPLTAVVVLMAASSMWRFRWALGEPNIPNGAWFWLPWIRMLMSLASDAGRVKSWLNKG